MSLVQIFINAFEISAKKNSSKHECFESNLVMRRTGRKTVILNTETNYTDTDGGSVIGVVISGYPYVRL